MYTQCRSEHRERDELTCSRLELKVQELEREVCELKVGQNVAYRLENLAGVDTK